MTRKLPLVGTILLFCSSCGANFGKSPEVSQSPISPDSQLVDNKDSFSDIGVSSEPTVGEVDPLVDLLGSLEPSESTEEARTIAPLVRAARNAIRTCELQQAGDNWVRTPDMGSITEAVQRTDCLLYLMSERTTVTQEEADEAKRLVKEVKRQCSQSIPGLFKFGDEQQRNSNYEGAIATFEAVLWLDPGSTVAQKKLESVEHAIEEAEKLKEERRRRAELDIEKERETQRRAEEKKELARKETDSKLAKREAETEKQKGAIRTDFTDWEEVLILGRKARGKNITFRYKASSGGHKGAGEMPKWAAAKSEGLTQYFQHFEPGRFGGFLIFYRSSQAERVLKIKEDQLITCKILGVTLGTATCRLIE